MTLKNRANSRKTSIEPPKAQAGIAIICIAIFIAMPTTAFSQQRLRTISEVQVDASLAAIDRAIEEVDGNDGSRELLRKLRKRRNEITANARELRNSSINPFNNRPPPIATIVNGTTTQAFGATGALLTHGPDGGLKVFCSGIMIGCETFLTARHCVEHNPDPEKYFVYLPAEGIFGIKGVPPEHPDYEKPYADLQLLTLERPVTAINPAQLSSVPIADAEVAVTTVGFGRTNGEANDQGIKRFGSLTTDSCPENGNGRIASNPEAFICWLYDDNQSTTCHFDSGGPLFPGTASDTVDVIGVTSGGDVSCQSDALYYDVDLQFFKLWLSQTGGADVGKTSCEPEGRGSIHLVQAQAIDCVNTNCALPTLITHSVKQGTQEVRIGLNAEDRQENELDLEVLLKSSSSDPIPPCIQNNPRNFEFCSFTITEPDTELTITVRQKKSGSGKYQLLVSELRYDDTR